MGNLKVAVLIGLWWICSIWANVYSKKVFLYLHEYSIQLTFAQTSSAVFIVGFVYHSKLFKERSFGQLIQRISIKGVVGLSILHALGNLFTNVSMESTNVAFAHTIKAAEPIFTIYFSRLMGKHEPFSLYLATIPVMLGVAISSLAEVKFSVLGFTAAVLSNSCFAYRNVSVKKLEEGDNLGIFFLVSCGSSIILALIQAFRTTFHQNSYEPSALPNSITNLVYAAVLHCSYNIFSFLVLGQVAPLTHAVINLIKRAAVIMVAIIAFSTPVTALNMTGIIATLAGGALFSFIKLQFTQKKRIIISVHGEEEAEQKPTRETQQEPSFFKLVLIIGLVLLAATLFKPEAGPATTFNNEQSQDIIEAPPVAILQEEFNPCPTDEWKRVLDTPQWPTWKTTQANMTTVPIIVNFGHTAMSRLYHFGQFGASYMVDRQIRLRWGDDAIVIPIGVLDQFVDRVDENMALAERVIYNWEGTFHGHGGHCQIMMKYLHKITEYNAPTYHINIAWYPAEDTEPVIAGLLRDSTTVEYLAARDLNSYQAMQAVGLTTTRQAADMTFLLPNQFSCEVNEYFTNKNRFWAYAGGFKVVVTMTSLVDDTKKIIYETTELIKAELGPNVQVVSMLDNEITNGLKSLEHLREETIFEAMWLLKQADLVITGRFHCGTFARLAGVPTVLLPGNTPKVDQLAQMINSPAYPMVRRPTSKNESWAAQIWNAGKEAVAYAKEHPLEQDGILDRLRDMARNNWPYIENDPLFNTRVISMEDVERELSFHRSFRNVTLQVMEDKAPRKLGVSYDAEKRNYIFHELI